MSAYEKIKLDILNGSLPPGSRLREEEIARKLEISRTPVREAIRQLAAENLVIVSPNKGATVKEYTIEEIKNAYDLRALIEGYAASLAAQNNNSKLLDILKKSNTEYEEKVYKYINDEDKTDLNLMNLIESNRKYHNTILTLANNKYIPQIVSLVLTLPVIFQSFYWFNSKEFVQSIEAHNYITNAIISGEIDQARVLMTSHVLYGRDYVLRNVMKEMVEMQ